MGQYSCRMKYMCLVNAVCLCYRFPEGREERKNCQVMIIGNNNVFEVGARILVGQSCRGGGEGSQALQFSGKMLQDVHQHEGIAIDLAAPLVCWKTKHVNLDHGHQQIMM